MYYYERMTFNGGWAPTTSDTNPEENEVKISGLKLRGVVEVAKEDEGKDLIDLFAIYGYTKQEPQKSENERVNDVVKKLEETVQKQKQMLTHMIEEVTALRAELSLAQSQLKKSDTARALLMSKVRGIVEELDDTL